MADTPIAIRVSSYLIRARNGKLIATFIAFVLIQLLFAALYFWLYKRRRDNFRFNADILSSQSTTVRTASERSLIRLKGAILALHELGSELGTGNKPNADGCLILPSGCKCEMVFLSGPPHGGPFGCRLEISDSNGDLLLRADPNVEPGINGLWKSYWNSRRWLKTAAEWQSSIPRIMKQTQSKEQAELDRVASFVNIGARCLVVLGLSIFQYHCGDDCWLWRHFAK